MAGDDCLRKVAKTLSKTLTRAADLVARYGGEEFSAILPETSESRATNLAEELRFKVESLELDGIPSTAGITISIGVATEVPSADRSAEDLIRRADASLYVAKHEGRNLVHSNPGFEIPRGLFESDA